MAYAKWQYPYSLTPEQKAEKARLDEADKLEYPLPEGSNVELHRVFFSALVEKRAKWMDESKDYRMCKSQKPNLSICTGPFVGVVWHNLALLSWSSRLLPRLYLPFSAVQMASPLTSFLVHWYQALV